ncbi:uncharacterized protein LOC130672447 [Microplitis mediator]|uniref:uncharacterized protein LOC130672447 n=1 Tax=Microplitis mediator TaxID=375433 RepID=UPI0025531C34|nr:uncharacterized protein LOC130672447 [Microplitis mediator]
MMLINYLIFVIMILFNISSTFSINLDNIFKSDQLKSFMDELDEIVINDQKFINTTLKKDTKNNELKAAFNNLTNILEELNLIANHSTVDYELYKFDKFLNTLEEHQIKNGYVKSFFNLTRYKKHTEEISNGIDAIVRSLIYFRNKNISDYSVHLCSFSSTLLDFVQHDEDFKYFLPIYIHFLLDLETKMAHPNQYSFCGKTSSFANGLVNYNRYVLTSSIKKYTIDQYSKIIEARCQNLRPTPASDFIDLRGSVIHAMAQTDRILQRTRQFIHRCDFEKTDNTYHYYELDRLVQKIIIEEKFLSTSRFCDNNCDLSLIRGQNNTECDQFMDCQYIGASFDICESNKGSSRRYEWFNDDQGKMYGGNIQQQCDNPLKSVSSYYNYYQLHHCDYCVCTCVTNPQRGYPIVNAISFRDQVTDIGNNEVVTGVRFVKKDRMIHVQIKKGKLKPQNVVGESSWKDLENFVHENDTGKIYVQNSQNISTECKLGTDYGHVSALNFDDVFAHEGFVVSGVRFRLANNYDDYSPPTKDPIELQIRVTPFDYISGKLIDHDKTHWVSPKIEVEMSSQYNFVRKLLVLNNPDNPTKSPGNVIDSSEDQFIQFRASDLKKDAGQSTVPFFDAQDVEGAPEFPLGGVGIIHRGREGYGGFLAFRIFDCNLYKYFQNRLHFQ